MHSKRFALELRAISTTAHTILRLHTPDFQTVTVPITPPSLVFDRLSSGDLDAALLIHEGRLIYPQLGYQLILDIGAWWSEETNGLPLPLGGMVIRRSLGMDVITTANRVIRRSIEHALLNRSEAIHWLLERGSGPLQTYEAVDQYLHLYANEDSLDYGADGQAAIVELTARRRHSQFVPSRTSHLLCRIDESRRADGELITRPQWTFLNRFSIDFHFGDLGALKRVQFLPIPWWQQPPQQPTGHQHPFFFTKGQRLVLRSPTVRFVIQSADHGTALFTHHGTHPLHLSRRQLESGVRGAGAWI